MSTTNIEWTERTWNPIAGCTKVSPGCKHCYAETMANRLAAMGQEKYARVVTNGRWNGRISFDEHALTEPLRRKKPTRYFVNSMSDLFHEAVTDEMIDRIMAVIALCPQHTFQVLTKRPKRMRDYIRSIYTDGHWNEINECANAVSLPVDNDFVWNYPRDLPNLWLGVSVELQSEAEQRIPLLLETPAAVRFLSCEPLLGPLELRKWLFTQHVGQQCSRCGDAGDPDWGWSPCDHATCEFKPLHWVIVGGESGTGFRVMELAWAEDIRRQCAAAEVAFFFKQTCGNRPGLNPEALGARYQEFPQTRKATP